MYSAWLTLYMTCMCTYSSLLYSPNGLNMNRIPYSLPTSAYSTCRLKVSRYHHILFVHLHGWTQTAPLLMMILHVEYAERGREYGILFIVRLFGENSNLEYVHIYAIYRVNQAEYVIHICRVAPQEYMNIYSTRKEVSHATIKLGLHVNVTPATATLSRCHANTKLCFHVNATPANATLLRLR